MKVVVSLKPLRTEAKTRGVGVYTKKILESLRKQYPHDKFIPTTHDYYHQDADLVHFPFFDPFFLTLPLRQTKPTVVTIHDLIPLKFPKHFKKGLRGWLKWQLQKRFVRKTDHIITDSQSSKRDILEILHTPSEKISVIPLASPLNFQKVPQKLQKTVKNDYKLPEKYLLYVGDINWNKNIPGLVREFAKLQDKSLHLVLVGKAFQDELEPKELKTIHQAIEETGVGDRVKLLGFVPSHHLPALYMLATAYIQPSFYEGFGFPVLEAMQHSCPVVSSNKGSLKEVGGDAAEYFDPYKKGDLKNTIEKLLSNPQKREELIKKGIKKAGEYSWDETARRTKKAYEKTLQK